MATLLDFRRRIRSVKNTQQITRAMKFVAAARLRRAQEAAIAARPYARELARMLRSIMSRIDEPQHPLLAKRSEERILAIVLTGERGLAGAFNANILRKAHDVFSEFKTVMTPNLVVTKRLPVEAVRMDEESAAEKESAQVDYIYEQPEEQLLGKLLPRYIETQLLRAMLESSAAEHAARMTAMESATKNAGDVIDALTLHMNKVRQAAITKEIIEIVSGTSYGA